MTMTERELICKALEAIRQCLISLRDGRGDHSYGWIDDINECIVRLEELPKEVNHGPGRG